jgi:hypothetical protein
MVGTGTPGSTLSDAFECWENVWIRNAQMTATEMLLKIWFCCCCLFEDLICTRFDPAHGTVKHSGTQRPDRHHEARLNRVLGSRVLTVAEHTECNADLP